MRWIENQSIIFASVLEMMELTMATCNQVIIHGVVCVETYVTHGLGRVEHSSVLFSLCKNEKKCNFSCKKQVQTSTTSDRVLAHASK